MKVGYKMSKKIKIGIAGIGRAGWGMHCNELEKREDKFEIVAACDLIESRRDKMKEKYNCKTYENIIDMINDTNVNLIDIATRSKDHFEHAMMALNAGKDVFLEKPVCLTYEDAKKLKEKSCNKNSGNLYIRHNRRFEPGFMRIMDIIKSGVLGNIFEVKMCRYGYSRRDDWQTLAEHGGGQLLNWGPHIIDQSLRFLGGSYKHMESYLKNMTALGDAEDNVKIVFTGHDGMVVDMEISGSIILPAPEYLVYGDKGSLTLTDDKLYMKYLNPDVDLPEKKADHGTPGEGFGTQDNLDWIEKTEIIKDHNDITMIWDKLYDTLVNGEEFTIDIDEALAVMEVVDNIKKTCKIVTM